MANEKQAVTKAQAEAHRRVLQQLLRHDDNRRCADCAARGPTWASVNLGVFVCLNCSGIHRSLGVDLSKVRSTTLDTWLPEQVCFVQRMGNRRANAFWEARLPAGFRRPAEGDMLGLRHFINDKYRDQRYACRTWDKPPTIETYLAHPFMQQAEGEAAAPAAAAAAEADDPGRLEPASGRSRAAPATARRAAAADAGNVRLPESARAAAVFPPARAAAAASPATPELFDLLSLDEPAAAPSSAAQELDLFSDPGSSSVVSPQAAGGPQHRATLSQDSLAQSVPDASDDWAAFVSGSAAATPAAAAPAAAAAADHWDAFQDSGAPASQPTPDDPFATQGTAVPAAAPQPKFPSAPPSPGPQQQQPGQKAQAGLQPRHRAQKSAEEILRMFDQPKPATPEPQWGLAGGSGGGSGLPPLPAFPGGLPAGFQLPPPPPGMENLQLPGGVWAAFPPLGGGLAFPPLDAASGLPGAGLDLSSLQGGWATLPGAGPGSGSHTTQGML